MVHTQLMYDEKIHLPSQYKDSNTLHEKTNPFLVAAAPLLMFITQIRQCEKLPDIDRLHKQILYEIKQFISILQQRNYPRLMIECASYCLCAAIDEAVLARPWGAESFWSSQGMLSLLRGETWGGERFYIIAETLLKESDQYIYVLEVMYVLLSIGFEGRYYGDKSLLREELRSKLFQKIRVEKGKTSKILSYSWRNEAQFIAFKHKWNSLKKLVITCALFSLLLLTYYNICCYHVISPRIKLLQQVAMGSPIGAFNQLIKRHSKRYFSQ